MATVTEFPDWCDDGALTKAVRLCIDLQRDPATNALADYEPCADALRLVDEDQLRPLLASGRDVHGVARETDISNAVVFGARHITDAVLNDEVIHVKRALDQIVARKAAAELKLGRISVRPSGQFWYPPGGYMGWHTNSGAPGLRLYISHAAEPGKSFFRYLDADTDQVNTSYDDIWNVRLFPVDAKQLFWHAVYSETDRFSFGYTIVPMGPWARLRRRLKRLLG